MPRLAAMPRSRTPGSRAMHSSTRAWLVRKLRLATLKELCYFWKYIASFQLQLYAAGRHRGPAAERRPGAPGSPEGAAHGPHRPGHRRARGARGAAHPAEAVGAGREFAGPDPR